MAYTIKELSQEEVDDMRIQSPYATIGKYQLMDDEISLGYEDTREEAEAEIRKWEGRDAIRDTINDKLPVLLEELDQQASWYGLDSAEVHSMLKESI